MTEASGPLAGIRVVELGGIGPGPFAGMLLADQGAEVIRIDRPAEAGTASKHPILHRGRGEAGHAEPGDDRADAVPGVVPTQVVGIHQLPATHSA